MNIVKILQGSLSVALIHLVVNGVALAAETMPSIQALYDSNRPSAAQKVAVKPKPIPAKRTLITAKPTTVAPRQTVTEPLSIVAEWPTYYLDEMLDKKYSAKRAAPAKPVVVAPKSQPAKPPVIVKAPETKPVVAKPAPKPVVAKALTESQRDPATAKKLDISKLNIFGPQSSSFRYDSRMVRAMEIASARAYGRSQGSCWRYVKNALLSAGLVDSRPTTAYAKQAAGELTSKYGFRRIACSDPYKAPIGSVLVYGGGGAGHVEFRSRSGFVSDFTTPHPSKRPLIGVYVK